ncbi:MAG: hypothetical protein O2954_15555 [bacterium]|nr:hypothetical protein [bacterium]
MRYLLSILLSLALATPALAADIGQLVTTFSLQGTDGRLYSPVDYRRKVLVLYFMGYS